jgi:hypothetical protein
LSPNFTADFIPILQELRPNFAADSALNTPLKAPPLLGSQTPKNRKIEK